MRDPIHVAIESDLEPLMPRYLQNRRADLEVLAECLRDGEYAPAMRIGHGMKGSGGGYGLPQLSELGARLEQAAKAGQDGVILALRQELEDFLDRLVVTFVDE